MSTTRPPGSKITQSVVSAGVVGKAMREVGRAPWSSTLRLRHDADIGPWRLPTLRVDLLRLVVRDGAGNDHIIAVLPIDRRRHAVLGRELQRVDDAQHLVEISAGGHRV